MKKMRKKRNVLGTKHKQSKIVSLCEMPLSEVASFLSDKKSKTDHDELLIGSEFCFDKFSDSFAFELKTVLKEAKKQNKKVIFVFPILPQRHLDCFKRMVQCLADSDTDGIAVNDFGALSYIKKQLPNMPIVLGRLWFKSPRDFLAESNNSNRFPFEVLDCLKTFDIKRIFVDTYICNPQLQGIEVCVHSSTYLSSSMSCEYKQTKKHASHTVMGKCMQECFSQFAKLSQHKVIRLGNAVLFAEEKSLSTKGIVDCVVNQLIIKAGDDI